MKIISAPLLFILCFIGLGSVSAAALSDVVISEIAWMGAENSGSDEWIELKNNTGQKINLDGWVLKAADGTPKIQLGGAIPAAGFHLLKRGKDYTGALENTGEILELYNNSGKLIDKVEASGGWLAGDNQTKQTMEKTGSGWQTSQKAGGTPAAENSKVLEKASAVAKALADKSAGKQADVFSGSSSKSFYIFLTAFGLAVFSGTAILFLKNML